MKRQDLSHKKTNLIRKNSVILKFFSFLIRNFAASFARFLHSNIRKNFEAYCIKIKNKDILIYQYENTYYTEFKDNGIYTFVVDFLKINNKGFGYLYKRLQYYART